MYREGIKKPHKLVMTEEIENKGWECPRCHKVNSPEIKSCDCVKTEDKDKGNQQLLVE